MYFTKSSFLVEHAGWRRRRSRPPRACRYGEVHTLPPLLSLPHGQFVLTSPTHFFDFYITPKVLSKTLPRLAMDMSSHFCGACGAVLLLGAGGAPSCDVCGASLPSGDVNAEMKLVTRRRLAPSETLRQLTEAATDVGGAQEAEVRFCLGCR